MKKVIRNVWMMALVRNVYDVMLNKKRFNIFNVGDVYSKIKWLIKSLIYNDDWMNNYG